MADNCGEARERMAPDAKVGERWVCRAIHSIEQVWPVVEEASAALKDAGFGPRQVFAARLALEEAVSNGVKHGNRRDPKKTVRVRFHVDAREFRAEVEDEGPGFNLAQVPDPRAPENLEREGGRGILLIRRYMTRADYNERGNCLRLLLVRH